MLVCVVCIIRPPQFTDSLMCGPCYGRLKRDIATLVGAHTWLGIAMCNPSPAFKAGTIHRAGGPRPPFSVALHDARTDIAGKLSSWARLIAEEHRPALAGPADTELPTVARWMIARLPWVSDQPWCDVIASELHDASRSAYGLVPWDRARRDLPLPCPAPGGCDLLMLCVYSGSDTIMCRNPECLRTLTWADYEAAVREMHGKVTAPMIQEVAA